MVKSRHLSGASPGWQRAMGGRRKRIDFIMTSGGWPQRERGKQRGATGAIVLEDTKGCCGSDQLVSGMEW